MVDWREFEIYERKDSLWKKYKRRGTVNRYQKFCQARNRCTEAIRKAKIVFEKRLSEEVKENPKAFYAYCRSKTSIKEKVCKVDKGDGSSTENDKGTADVLNRAFQDVFVRENPEIPRINPPYTRKKNE